MHAPSRAWLPFWFALLLCPLTLTLPGCAYIAKQAKGQFELLAGRVPLDQALETEDFSNEERELLHWVPRIKQFGEEVVGLSPTKNYTTINPEFTGVIWNVSAAAPDRFQSHRYHYPVVGSLPYIGFWSKEADRAEWSFETKKDGAYEVWIDWALPDKDLKSKLNLTVSNFSLSAPVPGTGSWDKYQWGRMGKIELKKGVHRATVRSEGPLNSNYLMDLREVRLLPKGQESPAGGIKWAGSKTINLSRDQ